jgi:biotin transporter BioY
MPDREGVDVGVRGARRGIAVVVAATGGYLLVLWLLALLASWIVRVT